MYKLITVVMLCLCVAGCGHVSNNQTTAIPPPTVVDDGHFVNDSAGVLGASDKEQLEATLRNLYGTGTAQIKILTIDTTGGEDADTYALRTAQAWKLGKKEKNNGVFILLAVNDRKLRIKTGYGMEEKLPDSFCGTISRESAKQYFPKKEYGAGLKHIVDGIVKKLK